MKLSEVKVGDLIRPENAAEPWFAEVVEVEKGTDPLTGQPMYFVILAFEENEYSLSGPGDWEMEVR